MKFFFKFILLFLCYNLVWSQKEYTYSVYFETDKYEIPPIEKNRLLLFISKIEKTNIKSISIYGFCDDRGTNDYNLILSQQRADAIKSIFYQQKIKDSLITNVDGKGKILLKIINEKDLLKIRGLNRKVEILVKIKPDIIKNEVSPITKKKDETQQIKGPLNIGDKIVLKNILFKTGYASITSNSKKTLENIAKALVERNDIYFVIQGHVCCTKSSRDAIDRKTKKRNLSEARAKYIYNYFIKKGINKKRMRYKGMRRKFPLGGDPKYDRRVEILITHVSD